MDTARLLFPVAAHHAHEPLPVVGHDAHTTVPHLGVLGNRPPVRRWERGFLIEEAAKFTRRVSQRSQPKFTQLVALVSSQSASLHSRRPAYGARMLHSPDLDTRRACRRSCLRVIDPQSERLAPFPVPPGASMTGLAVANHLPLIRHTGSQVPNVLLARSQLWAVRPAGRRRPGLETACGPSAVCLNLMPEATGVPSGGRSGRSPRTPWPRRWSAQDDEAQRRLGLAVEVDAAPLAARAAAAMARTPAAMTIATIRRAVVQRWRVAPGRVGRGTAG